MKNKWYDRLDQTAVATIKRGVIVFVILVVCNAVFLNNNMHVLAGLTGGFIFNGIKLLVNARVFAALLGIKTNNDNDDAAGTSEKSRLFKTFSPSVLYIASQVVTIALLALILNLSLHAFLGFVAGLMINVVAIMTMAVKNNLF